MGYSVSMHKPMRAWELAHVGDEPQQHIVGLSPGHRKDSGRFLVHDDPRLQLVDHVKRRNETQDLENMKQGQSE